MIVLDCGHSPVLLSSTATEEVIGDEQYPC
jgi:hypothetical protein